MITCKICGKELKGINIFHLKLHNIKNESEYIKLYPDAKLYDGDYIKSIIDYNALIEFDGNFYHKQSINECKYDFQKRNFKNDKYKNNGYNLIRIQEISNVINIKKLLEKND